MECLPKSQIHLEKNPNKILEGVGEKQWKVIGPNP